VSNEVERAYLTSDEFRVAVDSLTQSELLRLYKKGGYRAAGTGMTGQELLNEAIVRTLDKGGRNCPTDVPIAVFLGNAMRSIASSERKKFDREPAEGDANDESTVIGRAASEAADPEAQAISKMNLEKVCGKLQAIFKDDPQAEAIVIGDMEGWGPTEIKELEPMDDNSYAAARRRVRRKIAQEFSEEDRP
tara:strand:- start:1797 stop:2369 length:573 start_codon:yes stop_codon:yes gene_type:complete